MALRRALFQIILLLAVVVTLSGMCSAQDFVTVQGDQFVLRGNVYKLKGCNYYPKDHIWADMWYSFDSNAIVADSVRFQNFGINCVRLMVPYSNGGWTWDPSESKLDQLEFVVNQMGEKGIRSVVTIFDWETSFPAETDPRWAEHVTYMNAIVSRLRDNPYVLMFDVKNEPDHPANIGGGDNWDGTIQKTTIVNWLQRCCNYIRSIDPNHPVTAGMRWYENINDVEHFVDVAICHSYWRPTPPAWPSPQTQISYLKYYSDKPIIFEEFGWPSGGEGDSTFNETEQLGAYVETLATWESMNTAGGLQWMAYDGGNPITNHEAHFGLWRTDYTLKPAAIYYRDNFPVFQFPSSDTSPPAPCPVFTANANGKSATIAYEMPATPDVMGLQIRVSEDSYPASTSEGTLVTETAGILPGEEGSLTYGDLTPGRTYYFSAFTFDTSYVYSSPVYASCDTPRPPAYTVKDARSLLDGTELYIGGVAVTRVIDSADCFYIQSADYLPGVRVDMPAGIGLEAGNEVEVCGISRDMYENDVFCGVKIEPYWVLKTGNTSTIRPVTMPSVETRVDANGLLSRLVGTVSDAGETSFVLSSNGESTTVFCDFSPAVRVSDVVAVTGVLASYVPGGSESADYSLLASHTNDLDIYYTIPSISGNVSNIWGDPVAGAQVDLLPGDYSALSDSDGNYLISDIVPGTYSLGVSAAGYSPYSQSNVIISTDTRTVQNVVLSDGTGGIHGYVRDDLGSAVSSATVSIYGGTKTATSDAEGYYELRGLLSGEYSVIFEKDGYTTQIVDDIEVLSSERTSLDINTYIKKGAITGTVRDQTYQRVPYATVTVMPGGQTVTCNSDGHYTVYDIAPGCGYSVTASKNGYYSEETTNVCVTAGSETTVILTISIPVEKLPNYGFEAGGFSFWGGTIANDWGAAVPNTGGTAYYQLVDIGSTQGHVQQIMTVTNGAGFGLANGITGLTPGAEWYFSVDVFKHSSNYVLKAEVMEGSNGPYVPGQGTTINAPVGSWTTYTESGVVPPGGDVSVYIWSERYGGTEAYCYFDNASLKSW